MPLAVYESPDVSGSTWHSDESLQELLMSWHMFACAHVSCVHTLMPCICFRTYEQVAVFCVCVCACLFFDLWVFQTVLLVGIIGGTTKRNRKEA